MTNRNTKKFWDRKLIEEEKALQKSPIYLDKNTTVANFLYGARGNLLDVGLGYGMLEKLLVERKSKLNLFGIDISNTAIRKINKTTKGNFLVASVLDIPFEKNLFDFVIALDVLEHLKKEELLQAFAEIKRTLKKNGSLVVSVPLNELKKDRELNRHEILFTKESLIRSLLRQGFEVEKIKLMFAFKNGYVIKSLMARIFRFREPNLVIVFCRQK